MTGGVDRTARIWDVTTGESRTLVGHTNAVTAVTFTHDGKYVFTASVDRSIRVWHARTAEFVRKLTDRGNAGGVYALALSPNGERLASGWGDGKIRVWDVAKALQA